MLVAHRTLIDCYINKLRHLGEGYKKSHFGLDTTQLLGSLKTQCPATLYPDLQNSINGIFLRQRQTDFLKAQALGEINKLLKARYDKCPRSFTRRIKPDNVYLGLHYLSSHFNCDRGGISPVKDQNDYLDAEDNGYFKLSGRYACPFGCKVLCKERLMIQEHLESTHSREELALWSLPVSAPNARAQGHGATNSVEYYNLGGPGGGNAMRLP